MRRAVLATHELFTAFSGQLVPGARREARFALLAGMVGALALARAVDDEGLSAAILRGTRGFWTRSLEPPKT